MPRQRRFRTYHQTKQRNIPPLYYDAIRYVLHLAKKYNLAVIEDAAQSFGATYKGQQSCGLSTIGCTSFFPSKPLGCYGDGGACFTNDPQLALRMNEIRTHGQSRRYYHTRLGINGRFDTMQAAFLLEKLTIFSEEKQLRHQVANRYQQLLPDEVKKPKPALDGFRLVIELSKLPPENILFIGDSVEKEVLPAKSLGILTGLIWSFSPEADYCFNSFQEILELVQ